MRQDAFGDRMKAYEAMETARRLDPTLPIYARIDGRSFSKFTRGMKRPYDPRLSRAMIETARHLVAHTQARLGYTQSDEISLIWQLDDASPSAQMFFDAKVQKLASVLAGLATAAFSQRLIVEFGSARGIALLQLLPHFDCRVFNLPSLDEGANAFLWRAQDAERNAVQMAAHHHFPHKQLQGKGKHDMLRMLSDKGIAFHEYPAFFQRGTFLRRATVLRPLSIAELDDIPEEHRPSPDALVTRSEVREIDMPPFGAVRNRVDVVFDGAEPQID